VRLVERGLLVRGFERAGVDLPVAEVRPDERPVPRPDDPSWGRPPDEDVRVAMVARLRDRDAGTHVPRRELPPEHQLADGG
jgi:hypothetical protein